MATVPQPSFFSPLKTLKTSAASTWTGYPISIKFTFAPKKLKISSALGSSIDETSSPNNSSGGEPLVPHQAEGEGEGEGEGQADPVKLAFAKAKAYKKAIEFNPTPDIAQNPVQKSTEIEKNSEELKLEAFNSEGEDNGNKKVPLALKLAFEKAKDYKKNKGVVDESEVSNGSKQSSGIKVGNEASLGKSVLRNDENKKEELKISSIDFVGLEFSEKKKGRGLPPGLVPVVDTFPEGDLPEVEILVGDASKFGDEAVASNLIEEEDSDVYKPKVSTWGVFPRPSNISKAFGGGRVIRPGEVLEKAEDRAAKEARTRQLLSAYKSKIGLNIHPKLKSECKMALMDGNSLMDLGKLKEALPFYEKIMDKLAFQTELHGLAALQWSICADSLSRPNEARMMYEKLQGHPNPQVSKKARQLIFSFQAMEKMKVTSSTTSPTNTGYQNYFQAFVKDNTNYPIQEAEVDDTVLRQVLPYVVLLLAPILFVILIAVQKGQS